MKVSRQTLGKLAIVTGICSLFCWGLFSEKQACGCFWFFRKCPAGLPSFTRSDIHHFLYSSFCASRIICGSGLSWISRGLVSSTVFSSYCCRHRECFWNTSKCFCGSLWFLTSFKPASDDAPCPASVTSEEVSVDSVNGSVVLDSTSISTVVSGAENPGLLYIPTKGKGMSQKTYKRWTKVQWTTAWTMSRSPSSKWSLWWVSHKCSPVDCWAA